MLHTHFDANAIKIKENYDTLYNERGGQLLVYPCMVALK